MSDASSWRCPHTESDDCSSHQGFLDTGILGEGILVCVEPSSISGLLGPAGVLISAPGAGCEAGVLGLNPLPTE